MVDRRGLLLAASGALVAGCGGRTEPLRSTPVPEREDPDVPVLNRLLDLEHRFVAVYARRGARRERDHVARLEELIRSLGAAPNAAHGEYDFSGTGSARAMRRTALRMEEVAVAAYVEALPQLRRADARALAAEILAEEAGELARARAALGRDPAPAAFVAGRAAP